MHRFPRRLILLALAAVPLAQAWANEPKGSFGLSARVEADGYLDPVLKRVVIRSVQPGLPAAQAGIAAGDSVVEIAGVAVAGAKALEMAERMKKKPGETLTLKLTRPDGSPYTVTLTAVAAP